jgi:hypothetical protein
VFKANYKGKPLWLQITATGQLKVNADVAGKRLQDMGLERPRGRKYTAELLFFRFRDPVVVEEPGIVD